jgi:hypothetical protein
MPTRNVAHLDDARRNDALHVAFAIRRLQIINAVAQLSGPDLRHIEEALERIWDGRPAEGAVLAFPCPDPNR